MLDEFRSPEFSVPGSEKEKNEELERARLDLVKSFMEDTGKVRKWFGFQSNDGLFVEKFKIAPILRDRIGIDFNSVEGLANIDQAKLFDKDTFYAPILMSLIALSLSKEQIDLVKQSIESQQDLGEWGAVGEIERINPFAAKSIVEIGGSEMEHISRGRHLSVDNDESFDQNIEALNDTSTPLFRDATVVTVAGGEYLLTGDDKLSEDYIRSDNYQRFVGEQRFDFCTSRGVFAHGSGIENTAGDYKDSITDLLKTMTLIVKDGGYSLHIGEINFDDHNLDDFNTEKVYEYRQNSSTDDRMDLANYPYFVILRHRSGKN